MHIVIAPDSFKESLSAWQVAQAIAAGFAEVFADARYTLLPMADGGEGTVDAFVVATGGQRVEVSVTGPLGTPVKAFYGLTGDGHTAVIEMAAASGLALVPAAARNPLLTTTRGTGELIMAALDAGARHLVIGLGGSATNDGGVGMAQALGLRCVDAAGAEIGPGGGALAALAQLDAAGLDTRLARCRIEVACDVDNPLTGPQGASAVFGPQKGATPAMVARLDECLGRLAICLKQGLGKDVADVPGAGAAGGMGAMMLALGGQLRPGVQIVADVLRLDEAIRDADLVITGEGRMDSQSLRGKTPVGVAQVARRHGKPVIALNGSLTASSDELQRAGLDAAFSVLHEPGDLAQALSQAAPNVRRAARNVAATLQLAQQLKP
ncbi:glycerate kinase [Silvimonas iriomotensis]|uniref:Glycerate kinase n=1 Tax=Silvimonas iriomotensis TaxID=449662 RepID=A0ABQ2P8Z0_9NEIS|nr:glycerate kinase [Silvimonas iriomotensis]GGP21299.1 glycerate kinase [Silvimonas iriomotensis]